MQEALSLLRWYAAMGVDEAIADQPVNRIVAATINPVAEPKPSMQTAPRPASSSSMVEETTALAAAANTLDQLRDAVVAYRGMSICRTATTPVFAEGVASPRVMVIGEAPGAEEDRQGIPFCGPSGQLLDRMLAAIGLSRRENAYITNTIFWRPPGNRNPSADEIDICRPFVDKHIALVDPPIIYLVGSIAIRALLNRDQSLGSLRGGDLSYHCPANKKDYPVRVSYHPSYLLRQPKQKKLAWQDLLGLKTALGDISVGG